MMNEPPLNSNKSRIHRFLHTYGRTLSPAANKPAEKKGAEKGNSEDIHISVLADKVIEILNPQNNQVKMGKSICDQYLLQIRITLNHWRLKINTCTCDTDTKLM